MKVWYSISNRDFTIYNKYGVCVAILNNVKIEELVEKFNLSDSDIHISF